MSEKTNNLNLSFKKYLKNRSNDYNQYGRYMARDLELKDSIHRLISFLGDIVVMVLPIIFWDYFLLLLSSGLLSYKLFVGFSVVIDLFIIGFVLIGNTYLILAFKGQTFGKIALNFKVVSKDNKELNSRTLFIREMIGIELPMLAMYFLFMVIGLYPFLGVFIIILINGLFVLIDKKHRSVIDCILGTKVVAIDDKYKKAQFEPIPEKIKEEKVMPAESAYDFHVYSSFSHDGEAEVEDLFRQAKEAGIKALSICDHNCVKANSVAEKIAPLYKIAYIPGINIDCNYKGISIRILGYFINSNDERFMQIEYENLAKERAVSARRVELFEEFTGFKVDVDKLPNRNRFQIISKEMIARQILSNIDYRRTKLLAPYLTGSKKDKPISHFCDDFFGKSGPAFVPLIHPDAKDMIALIKSSGGVPVLAHPMRSLGNNLDILADILSEGIKGIEIFTPYHTHSDMKYLIPLAKAYQLDITAGSEYHGVSRPKFILGKTYCPKEVESVILKFLKKYSK